MIYFGIIKINTSCIFFGEIYKKIGILMIIKLLIFKKSLLVRIIKSLYFINNIKYSNYS